MAEANENRGWLIAAVSVAVANALRAGTPAEDIAGAVAVELGDTSSAKVRVADALRREGYMMALRAVLDIPADLPLAERVAAAALLAPGEPTPS